ncbi:DUF2231 domain-containing protein [Bdellovibrio sp. NC01]|uniref:DUF2231 domain-containing protein n=1 Tax=Bdellovibrio sp. NC01 TaxID=2220073 RepID=UPI00115BCA66|nr:DUF2231 domain-containing protein [Bdellovibrio sp. NC01]QDK38625.1 hypothetical protein DOE51_14060 [Bdellovibrio sp. NC01]
MYSKVTINKHPVHPMLVAFPICLYVLTFVSFAVYATTRGEIFWYKLGFFSNMAAVACALVAAIPGFIDWAMGIPNGTLAKRDGLIHMSLNLITLALFAISGVFVNGTWDNPLLSLAAPLVLTGVGCITLLAAGYYGWTMVQTHKVGVDLSPEQEHDQEEIEHRGRRHEEPPVMYH